MATDKQRLLRSYTLDKQPNGGISTSSNSHNNEIHISIHTSYMSSRASYGTSTFLSDLGHETTYNSLLSGSSKHPSSGSSANGHTKLWDLPMKKKLMLVFLAAGNTVHLMAFSLIAPFFPREAQFKGMSPTVIGFVFSTYMLVSCLISPVYGANISRIGPKFMFIAGLSVGGTCAILFGLLEFCPPGTPFIVLCFLTRLMEALGMSAHTTVSFAIASNEFPHMMATVYGILEAASSFGFMIGPVAGSFLYEIGGFGLPFYVIGAVTIVGAALVFTCLPTNIDTRKKEQKPKLVLLKSGNNWMILATVYLVTFSNGFIDSNLALHAEKQIGVSPLYIGFTFTAWSLVYGVTAPVWGWLTDRKDKAIPMILVGSFIAGLSMFLIGPAGFLSFIPSTLWVLIVALSVHSLGVGWAIVPTMKCLIAGARDQGFGDNLDTFGAVSGLFQCFVSLGAFSGPFFGGMMVERIGFSTSAAVVGIIFLSMTAIQTIYFCMRRKH